MNGTKWFTKVVGCQNTSVGEIPLEGETLVRAGVDETKARMSAWVTQTLVKIQCLENLRVPSQGSSTEGEPRPKIRLKGVIDGEQVNILVPPPCWSQGTKEAKLTKRWLTIQGHKVSSPSFF